MAAPGDTPVTLVRVAHRLALNMGPPAARTSNDSVAPPGLESSGFSGPRSRRSIPPIRRTIICLKGGAMRIVKLITPLLAVMLTMAPATADTMAFPDPDDTRGPLDVASLRHGHNDSGLWHSVTMQGRWSSQALRGQGSYLYIWFSTDDEDTYAERRIWIDFHKGRLKAGLERYDEFSDGAGVSPIRRLRITRPSKRTVKVFFDRQDIGSGNYSWSAFSSYRQADSEACGRCFDEAPEGRGRGRIRHAV